MSATGRVLAVERGGCELALAGGERRPCRLSGELAKVQQEAVAPGDLALVADDDPSLVVEILPRRSHLSRPDPMNPRIQRVLAANIDRVLIVSAAAQPAFKPGLVDRALVAVEQGGAVPVVVLTKADLLDPRRRAALDEELAHYRELGHAVFLLSTRTGEGLAALASALEGRAAALMGHSGVGKSSLLNALLGEARTRTGEVRRFDGKGRHTTTQARLHPLGKDGFLIDTPGVRSFGLWALELETLRAAFPDLDGRGCRYDDCRHDREGEADCGVKRDLAQGRLAPARHRAWQRLLAEVGADVR